MFSGKTRFLIAMPSLDCHIFSNTVILMAEMDKKGALGFIVNMPTGTLLKDALEVMNCRHVRPLDIPILFGGPVQTDFFWMIHSTDFCGTKTMKIHEHFYLSHFAEIVPHLNDDDCPEIYCAGMGYAGWAPNQLDGEIERGSWWLDNFDINLLFSTQVSDRWNEAFKSLGIDPEQLIDREDLNPTIN
ncbi:MAG: YqgE/AlgH family protein [Proteobacteria bacterium]|nr:YqgE/AlgH family protein [Pseudomonadota bacterium]